MLLLRSKILHNIPLSQILYILIKMFPEVSPHPPQKNCYQMQLHFPFCWSVQSFSLGLDEKHPRHRHPRDRGVWRIRNWNINYRMRTLSPKAFIVFLPDREKYTSMKCSTTASKCKKKERWAAVLNSYLRFIHNGGNKFLGLYVRRLRIWKGNQSLSHLLLFSNALVQHWKTAWHAEISAVFTA